MEIAARATSVHHVRRGQANFEHLSAAAYTLKDQLRMQFGEGVVKFRKVGSGVWECRANCLSDPCFPREREA